jgi:hypothetical protein
MGFCTISNVAFRAENVDRINRNAFGRTEVHMHDGRSYIFDMPLAEVVMLVNAADAGRKALSEHSDA